MKTEPMIREMNKAYRKSPQHAIDQLMAEQSRRQRKRTIAENKLADVRRRIDDKLKELANPKAPEKGENV